MLTNRKYSKDEFSISGCCLVLGAGGISMSSIALLLADMGQTVRGYDMVKSELTERLEKAGIPMVYREDQIDFSDVGTVVYTGAIPADSAAFREAERRGIPRIPRSVFLGRLMKSRENRIGVAGTHGKSSTTGMLSQIFLSYRQSDPTIMIGATLPALGGGLRIGQGEDFIFEACEYKDSFLDFLPKIAVVLNIELDHTDYFRSIEQMKDSFTRYMKIACESGGVAVVNADNAGAYDASLACEGRKIYYSAKKDAEVCAKNISVSKGCASFDVYVKNEKFCRAALSVPGEFQISNALAAIAAACYSGVPRESVEKGLREFKGVARRFEFRKQYNGAVIIDDYAHHPDEIESTLSIAEGMEFDRIIAVFQPHTYTRTRDFFDRFTKAFGCCDEVIIADIYSAREPALPGVDAKTLAAATPNGKYLGDFHQITNYLRATVKRGDLVLILGAGDIIRLEV